MSRCHYITDLEAGRVLIPGCYGAAIYGKHGCYCPKKEGPPLFARVDELENRVKQLEAKSSPTGRVGCRECGDEYWDRTADDACPGCGEPLAEISLNDTVLAHTGERGEATETTADDLRSISTANGEPSKGVDSGSPTSPQRPNETPE